VIDARKLALEKVEPTVPKVSIGSWLTKKLNAELSLLNVVLTDSSKLCHSKRYDDLDNLKRIPSKVKGSGAPKQKKDIRDVVFYLDQFPSSEGHFIQLPSWFSAIVNCPQPTN